MMGIASLNPSYEIIVIASEAKQSMSPREGRMDCFVAALLAMTGHNSAFSRRNPPEVCKDLRPKKSEGAGNAGRPPHP
jgi:hypothetical protein